MDPQVVEASLPYERVLASTLGYSMSLLYVPLASHFQREQASVLQSNSTLSLWELEQNYARLPSPT